MLLSAPSYFLPGAHNPAILIRVIAVGAAPGFKVYDIAVNHDHGERAIALLQTKGGVVPLGGGDRLYRDLALVHVFGPRQILLGLCYLSVLAHPSLLTGLRNQG